MVADNRKDSKTIFRGLNKEIVFMYFMNSTAVTDLCRMCVFQILIQIANFQFKILIIIKLKR